VVELERRDDAPVFLVGIGGNRIGLAGSMARAVVLCDREREADEAPARVDRDDPASFAAT
jgi:hypothetical protein